MHAHVKFQTFGFNLQKIGGIQNEHLIVVCYSDLVSVFMVPYRPRYSVSEMTYHFGKSFLPTA